LRIHEIQLLINRELLDPASARIEALRKHMQRYKVEPRSERIIRYLIHLDRRSFDFQKPSADMLDLEASLSARGDWIPFRPEVIRFDVWVRARREGTAFYDTLLKTLSEPD
ncbi:MAG: hypothetical protein D6722_27620, partial [Bacteroidetes bacterium]